MTSFASIIQGAAPGSTINLNSYGTITGGPFAGGDGWVATCPAGLTLHGGTITGGVVIYGAVGMSWDGMLITGTASGPTADSEALMKFVGGTQFHVYNGELRGGACFGQLGVAGRLSPHQTPTEWLIEDMWVHHNGYNTGQIGGTIMPTLTGHTAVQDHSLYIVDFAPNGVSTPMNGVMNRCTFGPSPNGAVVKIGGTGTTAALQEGVRNVTLNDCKIRLNQVGGEAYLSQGGASSGITINNMICELDGAPGVAVTSHSSLTDDADTTFNGNRAGPALGPYTSVDFPGTTRVEGIGIALGADSGWRGSTTVTNGNSGRSPNYVVFPLINTPTSGILTWTGPVSGNTAPTAAFTIDASLSPFIQVNGSASSDPGGSIASYDWDWGDGSPHSTQVSASHNFTVTGVRTIRLTVTDNLGATGTITHTVTIAGNSAPTVRFSIDSAPDPIVNINASASTDNVSISQYVAIWGDGTATGPQVSPLFSHAYAANGVYGITVQAIDNTGLIGELVKNVEIASFAGGTGLGCVRRPMDMATFVDSYMAFGAHKGTTRPVCHFVAWPNVALFELASGQADAAGNFGAVGTTTLFGFPVSSSFIADYGVGSPGRAEGHTGALGNDGLWKDRMIATKGYTSGLINKTEIAYPGLRASSYSSKIPDSVAGLPSVWDPMKAFLTADHVGHRVVISMTQGGNDMLGAMGAKVVPENPLWTTLIADIATYCEQNIDEIIRINPTGQKLEIVWQSYPNLMVEDGVPGGWPPCATADAPFRSVWITNGFGQYYQANDDYLVEKERWAHVKAYVGPIYPYYTQPGYYTYFPTVYHPPVQIYIPSAYTNNLDYWRAQLDAAMASDILARAGGACQSNARSLDSEIWNATVANVNQTTINGLFHRLRDAQVVTAAKYAPGGPKYDPDVSVIYVDMTTAMTPDPLQTTVPVQYKSAPKAKFADGIHLNKTGFIEYWDKVFASWFPRSQFNDLACVPTAYPDTLSMANNTPGTINPTLNDDPGASTFAAVELHNTLTGTWVTTMAVAFTGTWSVSGLNVTFTPNSTFVGSTSVEYRFRAADGSYAASTITATVAPIPPNCPPQLPSLYVT